MVELGSLILGQTFWGDSPLKILETGMSAAIAWLFPRASATSVASIDSFVTVALFSGVGLLLSLVVVILDQYIPGEWF